MVSYSSKKRKYKGMDRLFLHMFKQAMISLQGMAEIGLRLN